MTEIKIHMDLEKPQMRHEDEQDDEQNTIPRSDCMLRTDQEIDEGDLVGTKITVDGEKYVVECDPHVWDVSETEIVTEKDHGELEIEGTCIYCDELLYTTVLASEADPL